MRYVLVIYSKVWFSGSNLLAWITAGMTNQADFESIEYFVKENDFPLETVGNETEKEKWKQNMCLKTISLLLLIMELSLTFPLQNNKLGEL